MIALAVEFAVLSMGGCLGSAHSLLATGMVLSGTNLQAPRLLVLHINFSSIFLKT